MKRIFLVILLFCSLTSKGQIDYFTLLGNDGFLIGCGVHLAPPNPFGHKDPWIIYLHGIDHLRVHPINANDTTRIPVISTKGTPKLVANAPMPLQHKPGGGPTDYYRYNVAFCQGDSDDSQWPLDKPRTLTTYIRNTYGATTDTSLMILVCYSLGGGGGYSLIHYAPLLQYFKYVVIIAGGYINTPEYPTIAPSGMNIDVFSTIGDQLASVTLADNWVNGIKGQNPTVIPNFFRLKDLSLTNNPTDHDLMVQYFAEDTTAGETYQMTNGDTWTKTETIYQRGLRFFGPKRQHLGLWLLLWIPFKPRRNPLKMAA